MNRKFNSLFIVYPIIFFVVRTAFSFVKNSAAESVYETLAILAMYYCAVSVFYSIDLYRHFLFIQLFSFFIFVINTPSFMFSNMV